MSVINDNETKDQNKEMYENGQKYWSTVVPTVDGMLGQYGFISSTDISGSKQFLAPFLASKGGKVLQSRALDCGAGIGRITKHLLLPLFDNVDMVEVVASFLEKAREMCGENADRIEKYICCGLQDFLPETKRYDVIWCQWVLGQLSDDDLVSFFKRCKLGLANNGIIIVKENVTSTTEAEFDDKDSSYTRPKDVLVSLLKKADLTILSEQRQKRFPKELYDVWMFALQ